MTPTASMKSPTSIKNQLLFDTCIIGSVYDKQNPQLIGFLDILKKAYEPCINKYSYLEFIRIARNPNEKLKIESFLEKDFKIMENPQDLFANCKEIYPLYSRFNLGKTQISIVDLINLTYLSRYEDLYFITFDHKDYPIQLLDRIKIGHIDLGADIQTWAIYKFNKDKFLQEYKNFQSPFKSHLVT